MASKVLLPHILITSGPTAVPIDDMRIISNQSTGEMGRLLANAFAAKGYTVTLLEGKMATTSVLLSPKVNCKNFFFYAQLDLLLQKELRKHVDVVIHAAAVSDFMLLKPLKGKMASGRNLVLELVPTKKILNKIKKIAADVFLVGFKLETKITKMWMGPKVRRLVEDAGCDLVVANSYKNGRYKACLVETSGKFHPQLDSKKALVKALALRVDQYLI